MAARAVIETDDEGRVTEVSITVSGKDARKQVDKILEAMRRVAEEGGGGKEKSNG
jgi:hypothetical protein